MRFLVITACLFLLLPSLSLAEAIDQAQSPRTLPGFIQHLFAIPKPPAFESGRPKHGGKLIGFALQDTQASPALYKLGQEANILHAYLDLNGKGSTPKQLAEAAAQLHAVAPQEVEAFSLTLNHKGIEGLHLGLLRKDMERLYVEQSRTPNEIWHNLDFHMNAPAKSKMATLPGKRDNFRNSLIGALLYGDYSLGVMHEMDRQKNSRAEVLYRTQAQLGFASEYRSSKRYYIFGAQLNFNLADNLDRKKPKHPSIKGKPVRSDLPIYQEQSVVLDNLYAAVPFTTKENLHFVVGYGYLEEMFEGYGVETLYRPLNGDWAFGASYYSVSKRDPFSEAALSPTSARHHTAQINAAYTAPSGQYTLDLRAGRYLAGDYGADTTLQFDGPAQSTIGIELRWSTMEEQSHINDQDADHFQAGVRLRFPLGIPFTRTKRVNTEIAFRPLGHDTAQSVRSPFSLMALTEPLTKTHIRKHWADIDQPSLYPKRKPKK